MDPFLAEIRIFAGTFAPRGWAFCDGTTLSISQNTALYSLLGTYYGGDGRTNFALPNLQHRAPMHWGQGAGLTNRTLGQAGGESGVTLQTSQLAGHTHSLNAVPRRTVNQNQPSNAAALSETPNSLYLSPPANVVSMSSYGVGANGGGQPHNNQQPYLALSFIIALQGIYPPRP